MTVAIAGRVHGTLDLDETFPLLARKARREDQAVIAVVGPDSIISRAFASLVPALDEVVVHVCRRRSRHLDIDIVVVALAYVAGRYDRMRVQIDAADERGFR